MYATVNNAFIHKKKKEEEEEEKKRENSQCRESRWEKSNQLERCFALSTSRDDWNNLVYIK